MSILHACVNTLMIYLNPASKRVQSLTIAMPMIVHRCQILSGCQNLFHVTQSLLIVLLFCICTPHCDWYVLIVTVTMPMIVCVHYCHAVSPLTSCYIITSNGLIALFTCFTQVLPYQTYCLVDPDTKVGSCIYSTCSTLHSVMACTSL